MSNLQINKKDDLKELLNNNKQAIARIDIDKQEDFKKNFIELWANQYLLKQTNPSEILEFAINITNLGISVNPIHKECYILPFKQKGGAAKLEAVIPKQGVQELAYQSGFMIESDSIWNIEGKDLRLSEMSYGDSARIDITNVKFVNDSFIGFYFTLTDLVGNVKPQNTVVGISYLKEVTKQLQDKVHQVATYEHKAFRRAMKDFFIPRNRNKLDNINKIDNLNYRDDVIETVQTQNTTPNKNISNVLKASNNDVVKDVTIDDITELYNSSSTEIMQKMGVKLKGSGWKEFTPQQLNQLKCELEEIK